MQGETGFLLVGVGASAGGLEAIEALFARMPNEIQCAFVVIQHLDPTHNSLLSELLSKATRLPVHLARDGERIEAGHIYVIAPNAVLRVEQGQLKATKPSDVRERRSPIDVFFHSMATEFKDRAVGVVFSGTGHDGMEGAHAIRAKGGLVIAQDPATAKFGDMPRAVINQRQADSVLAPEFISEELLQLTQEYEFKSRILDTAESPEEVENQIAALWPIVKSRTGHDFSGYRQGTVRRRIARRMQALNLKRVSDYVEVVRSSGREAKALFGDLLIGVTEFFRDTEIFEAFEQAVVPRILERGKEVTDVRVWVPGCATGEEAYSLAILFLDEKIKRHLDYRIQIFATDLSAESLDVARRGVYPESIAERVSPERLEKYFEKKDGFYQIGRDVRDLCIFSKHDLLRDPPFSRIDLISCRNLFIYLEPALQAKALSIFHYSLRPKGLLFLGSSETISARPELFRPIDVKNRFFQSCEFGARQVFPFSRAEHEFGGDSSESVLPMTQASTLAISLAPAANPKSDRTASIRRAFESTILSKFSRPTVMIDANDQVVFIAGDISPYLQIPVGMIDLQIVNLASKHLKADLRSAIHSVRQRGELKIVRSHGANEGVRPIDITVRRFAELGDDSDFLLVAFDPVVTQVGKGLNAEAAGGDHSPEFAAKSQLEEELREVKERLQSTIEQLESSNEELKSSNEELQSMNEEMLSSNEELQTSKEELQSLNVELETINTELNEKVEELNAANSDLANLFESTHIATIFLDKELRVKRFTPSAREVFHLVDSDLGRHIGDIKSRVDLGDLTSEVREVIRTLGRREITVHRPEGDRQYIARIHPYRTIDHFINGVVLNFVDVTELKRAQNESERLAAIVSGSEDSIVGRDLNGVITSWNSGAERLFGYSEAEAMGKPFAMLVPPGLADELKSLEDRIRRGERVSAFETVRLRKSGEPINISKSVSPIYDVSGRLAGFSSIDRDITRAAKAEEALRESEERSRLLLTDIAAVVWTASADGRFVDAQMGWAAYTGQPWDKHRDFGWLDSVHPEDRTTVRQIWLNSTGRCEPLKIDCSVWNHGAGDFHHGTLNAVPMCDKSGVVQRWVGSFIDREEEFVANAQVALAKARLEAAVRVTGVLVAEQDLTLRYDGVSNSIPGFMDEAILGRTDDDLFDFKEDADALTSVKRRVLSAGQVAREVITLHRNGETRDFDLSVLPRFAKNGRIEGIVMAAADVTRFRELERDLRAASQAKDDFLAMLGHELRNPLAPIRTCAELLQEHPRDQREIDQISNTLQRQTLHLIRLVDDLLDVSRVNHGKVQLKRVNANLTELVSGVVSDFVREFATKGVRLEFEASSAPLPVWVDVDRIAQTVSNLLTNAWKFSSPGQRVVVSARRMGDHARVSVQDEGIGMSAESLKNVFEPFTQCDRSLDRSQGGLGLGLALAKGLIDLHGGEISAASEGEGRGSEVAFTLPIRVSHAQVPLPPAKPEMPRLRQSPVRKILIIEDNVDARNMLKIAIRNTGIDVDIAADGPSGLEQASASIPDLIICDIGLPGQMNGYEVARKLRSDRRFERTTLMALTGYCRDEDKKLSRDAGFDLHIAKPVDLSWLKKFFSSVAQGNP